MQTRAALVLLFLKIWVIFADAEHNPMDLIAKWGYPAEAHTVQTEDGYLLTVHRIPHGKDVNNATKPPVFLQHCFLCSSADWLYTGPGKSLALILADAGYDVWLGNVRGNTYSRSHVSLRTSDKAYWQFSFHEMGNYDVPCMIDFVLEQTGVEKIYYIGHSMGTTVFYVCTSEHPEYNDKIRAMFSLAPAAYLGNLKSPIIRFLVDISAEAKWVLEFFGAYEFQPHTKILASFRRMVCEEKAITNLICDNVLFLIAGYDSKQLNQSMLPIMFEYTPAGTSLMNGLHYVQLIKTGTFRQYDFGPVQNMIKYGSKTPPDYDISKITVPVSLHYGDNDWIAVPADVKRLYDELVNPIGLFEVPLPEFNHLDFIWAIDAPSLVYDNIMKLMEKY